MKRWQISCKRSPGADMELREFPGAWQALLWLAGNISKQKIVVIVKIEE